MDVRGHKIAFDLAVAPCRELGQGVVADELGGAEPPLDERVLEGLEENRVGDAGVLDGLSEPLANLPIGQREPPVEVDEHRGRLVECADEIGGRWGVDRRLPSDRGVRRAQQRRRQADVRDPPSERRGHEAGEVGDDAASESDDHGVAPESSGDELVLDVFLDLAGFRGLPGGEDDEVCGPRAE